MLHYRTFNPLILDQQYVTLKTQVIKAERRLLKELGFCVHVKHPHKVCIISASRFLAVAPLILFILNDIIAFTRVLTRKRWYDVNYWLKIEVICSQLIREVFVPCEFLYSIQVYTIPYSCVKTLNNASLITSSGILFWISFTLKHYPLVIRTNLSWNMRSFCNYSTVNFVTKKTFLIKRGENSINLEKNIR